MNKTELLQSQLTTHRRRFAASATTSHSPSRWLLTLAAASLSAGILMASVVPGLIGADRRVVPLPAKQDVIRGERATTMPIYELPPISVVADRKTELAKIRDEERVERVKQARLKAPMKPPV